MRSHLILKDYEEIYRTIGNKKYIIVHPHKDKSNYKYGWSAKVFTDGSESVEHIIIYDNMNSVEDVMKYIDNIINERFYNIGMHELESPSYTCNVSKCVYVKNLEEAFDMACTELEKRSASEVDNDYYGRKTFINKEKWKSIFMK